MLHFVTICADLEEKPKDIQNLNIWFNLRSHFLFIKNLFLVSNPQNLISGFADHIDLIVDFLEKEYIGYVDQVFLYMLQVDDHPDLLETIKKSNPKLKEIAMSVAERLKQEGRQEGRQEGIRIGEEKGKEERNIEIAKSMLLRGYPLDDIVVLTGLSPSSVEDLI